MGLKATKLTLTEEDLELLQKQSKKSKEEILFWYENFLRECPSGKLNKEKFVQYYKLFRKNEDVEEIANRCFYAFDFDKNNEVDFREFFIAYTITSGIDETEKLHYVFDLYDLDQNKVLDKTEIKLVLKSMFKLLGLKLENVNFERCLANVMNGLDKNKDSKISKQEFVDGVLADPILYTLLSPF